ncbi:MAG: class I SAM-dependent methyltransferase [Thermoplasmata archaeon]|nr:class I SAM-dependent methyltransferase [Thermoplasmata archaeon]
MAAASAVNQEKLNEFLGKFVGDIGSTAHGATVLLGERLGLYRAMADGKEITAAELARKTSTHERNVLEWLSAQAVSGYVNYNSKNGKFYLTPEQSFTLADEKSPAYLPGAFQLLASIYKDEPKIVEAFRSGKGLGWEARHPDLFTGVDKFFRPGYLANLVSSWLPALDGVVAKLTRGARVADIGCGHGSSTTLMAQAFPKSEFFGFDYHAPSIEAARKAAAAAGLGARLTFEVASAQAYPGKEYDLVAFFDCLHDMGDPQAAAAHVRQSLKDDGTWMIVEPNSGESLAENMNPVSRVFYSASTMICVPASLAQPGALGLGAQTSEARLRELVTAAGFGSFRRATQTPFNRVFEAKPSKAQGRK